MRPFAVQSSSAYNDGSLGQVNPLVARCRTRCGSRGRPTTRCVADCIKKTPLLGLGEEVSSAEISNQMRTLTIATGLTGLLVAGLLLHQLVTRSA